MFVLIIFKSVPILDVIVMNCVRIALVLCALVSILRGFETTDNRKKKAVLVKKHLKRLKKLEGGIKLVGGKGEYEGNFSDGFLIAASKCHLLLMRY